MKRITVFMLITVMLFGLIGGVAHADKEAGVKSSYTMEYNTGYVISGVSPDERYPIASMVKIMTALLCFEAIDRGDISLDQAITISENASGMGGSQMFLDTGLSYTVSDLIKGIIVVSANDACVAMAEAISGSEEAFVDKMNDRAREMGLVNTLFCNCTGLPGGEQYSSAHDVAYMMRELTKHDGYYDYSSIWIEDYIHPDGRTTQFVNTNKLIRFYKGCLGGKTGFTNEAMFCLAANAERNGMRIISVVIGADSSKTRFSYVSEQFNEAFCNYRNMKVVSRGDKVDGLISVNGGKVDNILGIVAEDYYIFGPKGKLPTYETEYKLCDSLNAPVKKGDVVGQVVIKVGEERISIDIVSDTDVEVLSYKDSLDKVLTRW